MLRLIGRRLTLSAPLLLVASLITFLLEYLVPGDAAVAILAGSNATQADVEAMRHRLGLDRPLWQQYADWLGQAVHGDLGRSLATNLPVTKQLNGRLGVTLSLMVGVLLVCGSLGLLLGTASALRGGALGRAIDLLSLVGLSVPSFWAALLLIAVFAVTLRWLPATGYVDPSRSLGVWLASLVLPVVALSLVGVTNVAKQTRDAMLDVLHRPFITTLRASGIAESSIIWKHALKNAAIPSVTVLGLAVTGALSGAVFVESVFVLPGLGTLAIEATQQHDIPIIEGIAVYFTIITIGVNLCIDLMYGWLNPKVRVR
jgi:peptide/nickel transport system permease protein